MKKTIRTIAILFFSLLFVVSCSPYKLESPSSYVSGENTTWKDVFTGYWTGMNNNYVFWNLDSPSGEWDAVYNEYVGQFEALGKVDYTNVENTKKATKLLFKSAQNLSDGHYYLKVPKPGDADNSIIFYPSDCRIIKEKYPGTEDQLLEAFANDTSLYSYYPDDYISETTKGIITRTFDVDDSDTFWENNFLYVSSVDVINKLPESIKSHMDGLYVVGLASSKLDTYFDEWMLLNLTNNTSDPLYCLLGITKEGTGIPGNCIYFGFSSFAFYPNMKFYTLDALLEIFRQYKHDDDLVGLVMDVRGNGGGFNYDRSILFSDLVDKDHQYAWYRGKLGGDNRLDYGPWLPVSMHPYVPGDDETDYSSSPLASKPMVALTNKGSVSNSEIMTLFLRSFPKGVSIGGRTWGGNGSLSGDDLEGNAGEFKVGNYISSVYTPYIQLKALDGTMYEGKGIPPTATYEVPFVKEDFASGTDARLEKAFAYVKDNLTP